ncbi:MAG: bifunctional hydroxymethylpyrimidine kinase/phosphomethylpyrimidine kinase, partial [Lachnospiraceae bacterium]|nr:bifunctional hydroxymethylpyrimidine kinase/phosphomethylpyrimidine kinase [Lachnospiraceae bacterium]
VDASGELLRKALSYGPFLIKPNHQELGEFFGRQIAGREEAAEYAKNMKRMGARNVLVSMGEKGAVLAAEDGQIYQADAPCGKVIHAVGAGDSMVAGFLAGYMKNASFEEALRWGVCAGSASAFSHDLTTGEKFRELYQSYAPK